MASPVKSKVAAGMLAAGAGGGLAAVSAPDVAAFIVDLTHLQLSEAGMRGLAVIVTFLWGLLISGGSSFVAGYMKREVK